MGKRLSLFGGRVVIEYGDGVEVNIGSDKPRRGACAGKDKLDQRAAESRVRSLEKKYKVPYDAYECGDHWHVGHSHKFFTLEEKYASRAPHAPA